jgi:hypothetical protein
MKQKIYLAIAGLFLFTVQLKAQTPNAINYQGAARNSSGNVLQNQHVGLEFTILQGSATGTNVYEETDTTTTNQFGLFSVSIGMGTQVGSNTFASVNWGANTEYLEVAMDATGGTTYVTMGTQQLLSVPYALSSGSPWATFGTEIYNTNSGFVGIGTASPGNPLNVFSAIASSNTGEFDNTAAGGTGVWGNATGTNSWGVYGNGTAWGVEGFTLESGGYGVEGVNGYGTADAGIGILGIGGGTSPVSFNFGEGVLGIGNDWGVMGYATDASPDGTESAGGFLSSADNTYYAYIATWDGTTNYKIQGTGTVSTIVKDQQNNLKAMACPEAPEILFEDYGTSALVNGTVHINLDPTYSKNVTINAKHPLRVMITMNDACPNGVYVTNRTTTGFDVVENNKGTSNATFTYEVIANRADETNASGKIISKNADIRFADAPGPLAVTKGAAVAKPVTLSTVHAVNNTVTPQSIPNVNTQVH